RPGPPAPARGRPRVPPAPEGAGAPEPAKPSPGPVPRNRLREGSRGLERAPRALRDGSAAGPTPGMSSGKAAGERRWELVRWYVREGRFRIEERTLTAFQWLYSPQQHRIVSRADLGSPSR
ncbi:translation initiation factor IF-2-like, partial [Malurus melanocephalus]|uniref:translation initiation factor IF-2-like n=1 Tax=Malurus melanocephalus TaxID=175006 RepID=UPI0025496047